MTRPAPRFRPTANFAFVAVALAALTATAAGARAWLTAASPAAPALPVAATQGQAARERLESELITVTPAGFDPHEIARPRGRFLLAVENRSGLNELDLRLDREAGGRLREARMPWGHLRWRDVVDLPPGRYVLTEVSRPEWACRITITPN